MHKVQSLLRDKVRDMVSLAFSKIAAAASDGLNTENRWYTS